MISLIIPIYNVGKKIENLIKNLNNYKKFIIDCEILFIDDGSLYDEYKIIKKNAAFKYKYFKKKNGGLNSARLYGINKSTNKYIWFIDSDDEVILEKFEEVKKEIKTNNPDILCFNFIEKEGTSENLIKVFSERYHKKRIDKLIDPIKKVSFRNCSMWSKIFSKKFLIENKINFEFNLYHEDTLSWFQSILKSKNIYFYNAPLYKYYLSSCDGELSIINKLKFNRKKHINDILAALENVFIYYINNYCDFLEKRNRLKKIINHYIISDLFTTKKYYPDVYKFHIAEINSLFKKYNFINKKMPLIWVVYYLNYIFTKVF